MKTIYLATPYSIKSPLARIQTNPPSRWDFIGKWIMHRRFVIVTKLAALLMTCGFNVFSPITHSHVIAKIGKLPALDHEFWLRLDKWYVDRCDEIWVLALRGWKKSKGVGREIKWAQEQMKPVYLIDKKGNVITQLIKDGQICDCSV